jgi:hypothetical protein
MTYAVRYRVDRNNGQLAEKIKWSPAPRSKDDAKKEGNSSRLAKEDSVVEMKIG